MAFKKFSKNGSEVILKWLWNVWINHNSNKSFQRANLKAPFNRRKAIFKSNLSDSAAFFLAKKSLKREPFSHVALKTIAPLCPWVLYKFCMCIFCKRWWSERGLEMVVCMTWHSICIHSKVVVDISAWQQFSLVSHGQ